MPGYLGIDVGSVSTDLVVLDEQEEVIADLYLRTKGQPIKVIQEGASLLKDMLPSDFEIKGVGTTGSGRTLAGVVAGADIVKNEITAHAVAASKFIPGINTILEIGGQDSKIIILRDGVVVDFAMNSVCAAGTGSFLDQQAGRLNIPIEKFGDLALKSSHPVRIAGRCTVFAESDMIHKQQVGHSLENIIAGLCEALVRNYLNNVGRGKEIVPPISFQGGVAANKGIKAAFEKELGLDVIIPPYFNVMGAIGAALLAKRKVNRQGIKTGFRGFDLSDFKYDTSSFECRGCSNHCEIIRMKVNGLTVARWGSRCGKWDDLALAEEAN